MFGRSVDTSQFYILSNNLMCVFSRDLKIKSANNSFLQKTGYTLKEVLGKNILEFLNQDDLSATQTMLDSLIKSEQAQVEISNRIIDKNKNNLWLNWSFYSSEKSRDIFAIAEDKTDDQASKGELMKVNRQIAEDKAKIDSILTNIGEGIIGITDKGTIYYVNSSAERMLGIVSANVTGKTFIQEIKAVNAKGEPASMENHPVRLAMKTGKVVYDHDQFFITSSGERLAVSITASPVVLQGILIGGVIIFRDITKEKEIDRMKTEFISLASHQLRTPLSAMKWFSEMLIDGDLGTLTEEQLKVIGNINKSNQRMIELVNSLLNISRIESGRMIIDPQPTDLKKMVDEVVTELQQKIEEKKHHLAISVHGDLPMINIDPKLVRHVYMNLLTNAIKYTPEGGEIVVLISRKDDEIISQVTDNGLGVPKAQQEKLFQKFFRADNVVRVITDGTGLGLYLIKAVVESSGGKIWFQSEEGKGSTFWFSLPISGSMRNNGEVSIDS